MTKEVLRNGFRRMGVSALAPLWPIVNCFADGSNYLIVSNDSFVIRQITFSNSRMAEQLTDAGAFRMLDDCFGNSSISGPIS